MALQNTLIGRATGPKRGRHRLPDSVRRDFRVVVTVREQEWADLQEIAREWNVHPGTAAFGLLADILSRLRGRGAELGSSGVALAASRLIARVE